MTTKDIRTSHAHTVCDVCGRTLLRGERAEIYINGGARRSVCELCKPRALHAGWIREGTVPDYSQSDSGSERGRSFLNRLRRGRDGGPRRSRSRPTLDDELSSRDWEQRQRPARGTSGSFRAWDRPDPSAAPPTDYGSDDPLIAGDQPEIGEEPAGAGGPPSPDPVAPDPGEYWEDEYEDPEAALYDEPAPYDEPAHYDERDAYSEQDVAPSDDPAPPRRPWSRRPRSLRSGNGDSGSGRPRPSRRRPPPSGRRPSRAPRPTGAPAADWRSAPREPRHVRAVPTSHEQKMAAAVNLFNQSEHRRTVAGVAKSLGGASVSVLPATESPSLVHVVVCWELCWYRYAVDLSEEVPGVRVEGQGYELSELDESERMANAFADETGQLILR